MWLADGWKDYEVIDSSDGEKLERWGQYILVRPDPQVIWDTPRTDKRWKIRTHTITAVKKAAVNGNSSISRNSGKSVIRILPLT